MSQGVAEQPIDNMIGFKERTPATVLRKWEKELLINAKNLTSACRIETNDNMSDKELS